MTRKSALWLMLAGMLCFFCACNDSKNADDTQTDGDLSEQEQSDGDEGPVDISQAPTGDPGAKVVLDQLEVIENPNNVLSVYVEWTSSLAATTELHVICTLDYEETFKNAVKSTSHQVFVMGLIPGERCRFDAWATDGTNKRSVLSVFHDVSAMPDEFSVISVKALETARVQPGWTLFNLIRTDTSSPLRVAMVDQHGRYRWYYVVETDSTGADNDVRVVPQGVLIGGTDGLVFPQIRDWEGKLKWIAEIDMHHHIQPLSDGTMLHLSVASDYCQGSAWDGHSAEEKNSETVRIIDTTNNAFTWQWAICDYYTPEVIEVGWAHLNGLALFPGENEILLSSRDQHSLFKFRRDTGAILWQLGLKGDFDIPEADQFYRQHSPSLLGENRILLFDNGEEGKREYSRALELEYDESAKTAHAVWEYRAEPDVFSPVWGDADRLPNGNTLVTFGLEYGVSHLIEVTADKRKVWEITLEEDWGVYRSERIVNPKKGYIIE